MNVKNKQTNQFNLAFRDLLRLKIKFFLQSLKNIGKKFSPFNTFARIFIIYLYRLHPNPQGNIPDEGSRLCPLSIRCSK